MKRGLLGLLLGCICLAGLATVAVAFFFVSLPDVTEMRKCITTLQYRVRVCPTGPDFTPLDQISPYIYGAVIMSEDAAFYSHDGVDFNEMKEAALKDINEGRYARGASTITQQLAKNVFLMNNKNILRKLEEIYLALQIEKHFSKTKILTLYLNVVEFGKNIYGVKAACQYYFHRTPAEVTPEEGAFLAFLLPNPKKYSQSYAKGHLTSFANKMVRIILHKMQLGHKISPDEYAAAVERVPEFPWSGPSGASSGATTGIPNAADTGGAGSEATTGTDESDQRDNDFQFDFDTEDSAGDSPTGTVPQTQTNSKDNSTDNLSD